MHLFTQFNGLLGDGLSQGKHATDVGNKGGENWRRLVLGGHVVSYCYGASDCRVTAELWWAIKCQISSQISLSYHTSDIISNVNYIIIRYHIKYRISSNIKYSKYRTPYQISDIISNIGYHQIQDTLSHFRYHIKYHNRIIYRIQSNISYMKYKISCQISDIVSQTGISNVGYYIKIRYIKYRI